MLRTAEILDKLAEVTGSDYKTAKALGMSPQSISNMRRNGYILSPDQMLKAADLLHMDPEFFILSGAAERSFGLPAFKELEALAEKYKPETLVKKAGRAAGILAIGCGAVWAAIQPAAAPFLA